MGEKAATINVATVEPNTETNNEKKKTSHTNATHNLDWLSGALSTVFQHLHLRRFSFLFGIGSAVVEKWHVFKSEQLGNLTLLCNVKMQSMHLAKSSTAF